MEIVIENEDIVRYIRNGYIKDLEDIFDEMNDDEIFEWMNYPVEWAAQPVGQTRLNRFTYAAAVNFEVFKVFVSYAVDINLVDPSNKTALCYCRTESEATYVIQRGGDNYLRLKTELEGKWMYPVHYMLRRKDYAAALTCFKFMEQIEGLPVVCDVTYGFLLGIEEAPGAVALVERLCLMGCYDDYVPFLQNGALLPYCGTNLLSRMCLSTTATAVRIVDCLCKYQDYPIGFGADMNVVPEADINGKFELESLFVHTLKNKRFVHLQSLVLKSKDHPRVDGFELRFICGQLQESDVREIKLEDFLGLVKTLFGTNQNVRSDIDIATLLRLFVNMSIKTVQNVNSAKVFLHKIASMAPVYDGKVLSLVYGPNDWAGLTDVAFNSGKDELWEFISKYGELNLSGINWTDCIVNKEGIGRRRIEKTLELNQQFLTFLDKRHRILRSLDNSEVQFLIFYRHDDLIRLFIRYGMLTPFEAHTNAEGQFYLTTSSLGKIMTIVEDDDEPYDKQKHEALLRAAYDISNEIRVDLACVRVAENALTHPLYGTYDPEIFRIVSQYILQK